VPAKASSNKSGTEIRMRPLEKIVGLKLNFMLRKNPVVAALVILLNWFDFVRACFDASGFDTVELFPFLLRF
jgi:hypothetical protein